MFPESLLKTSTDLKDGLVSRWPLEGDEVQTVGVF